MRSIIDNIGLTLLEIIAVIIPGVFLLEILGQVDYFSSLKHYLYSQESSLLSGLLLFGFAYFMGHVLYAASSSMDDVYDWFKLRRLKLNKSHLRNLELNKEVQYLSSTNIWWPKVLPLAFVHDSHNLVQKVIEIKHRYPATLYYQKNSESGDIKFGGTIMNAYQYSFRRLLLEAPSMSDEVQRYYATAKFFRSMILVFFVAFIISVSGVVDLPRYPVFLVLIFTSIIVYFNRWSKAIRVAMKNLIVLEEMLERN